MAFSVYSLVLRVEPVSLTTKLSHSRQSPSSTETEVFRLLDISVHVLVITVSGINALRYKSKA